MARTVTDYIDIPTGTTAVQLGSASGFAKRRIVEISIRSDPANTGLIYIGDSAVSPTNGYFLQAGEEKVIDYRPGSEELGYWYAEAAVNGENVMFIAVFFDSPGGA